VHDHPVSPDLVFIAHLPAGYLATTALLHGRQLAPAARRRLLRLGLAASVLPDLDLLYFYLVDGRRHVHHAYLPHLPLAWVAALGATAAVLWRRRATSAARAALVVLGANVLLHLVLDTVAAAGVASIGTVGVPWLLLGGLVAGGWLVASALGLFQHFVLWPWEPPAFLKLNLSRLHENFGTEESSAFVNGLLDRVAVALGKP
jgi:hypothetical protein